MTAPDSNRQPHDVSALAAIAVAHLLLGFLLLAPGYIRPDSVAVYSYVRSATIDRDLLFFNEWAGFRLIVDGVTLFKEVTPTGALANHWWIGTSLLVAPAYLLAHAVTLLTGWWPADGFFGLYAAVLVWATVVFGVVTSSIAYFLLGRLGIRRGIRIASIVAVWLGTPLLWYEYRFPLGTHLAGAMCVSIIAWLSFRMISGEEGRFDALLLGVWFGLAIATRLQHVMLGPAILLVIAASTRRGSLADTRDDSASRRSFAVRCRDVALGAALPVAIQAVAWWTIYGTPLGPITSGANLTGVTWMPFRHVALVPVLFSSYHGLFTWAPVTLLCLAGLSLELRGDRRLFAMALLLMFLGEYAANSLLDRYFWGGMSFGPRRFVDLALPFVVGLAWLMARFRWSAVAAAIGSAWTLLLTSAALAGRIDLARDVTPRRLIGAAVDGFDITSISLLGLRSPAIDSSFLGPSVLALILLAICAAAIAFLLRRSWTPALLVSCLGAMLLFVASIAPGTRREASGEAARYRIDLSRAARTGPLLDQRTLLGDERDFYQHRGMNEKAERTAREIRQIDALLQSMGAGAR